MRHLGVLIGGSTVKGLMSNVCNRFAAAVLWDRLDFLTNTTTHTVVCVDTVVCVVLTRVRPC